MNELVNKISTLLDDSSAWTETKYTLDHTSGLQLWIAGKQYLGVHAPATLKLDGEAADIIWPKIEAIIGTNEERQARIEEASIQVVLDHIAKSEKRAVATVF